MALKSRTQRQCRKTASKMHLCNVAFSPKRLWLQCVKQLRPGAIDTRQCILLEQRMNTVTAVANILHGDEQVDLYRENFHKLPRNKKIKNII